MPSAPRVKSLGGLRFKGGAVVVAAQQEPCLFLLYNH